MIHLTQNFEIKERKLIFEVGVGNNFEAMVKVETAKESPEKQIANLEKQDGDLGKQVEEKEGKLAWLKGLVAKAKKKLGWGDASKNQEEVANTKQTGKPEIQISQAEGIASLSGDDLAKSYAESLTKLGIDGGVENAKTLIDRKGEAEVRRMLAENMRDISRKGEKTKMLASKKEEIRGDLAKLKEMMGSDNSDYQELLAATKTGLDKNNLRDLQKLQNSIKTQIEILNLPTEVRNLVADTKKWRDNLKTWFGDSPEAKTVLGKISLIQISEERLVGLDGEKLKQALAEIRDAKNLIQAAYKKAYDASQIS